MGWMGVRGREREDQERMKITSRMKTTHRHEDEGEMDRLIDEGGCRMDGEGKKSTSF